MNRWRSLPFGRMSPGLTAGLFAGRLLSEWLMVGRIPAAVALTLIPTLAGGWLSKRWPLSRTWPLLLLLVYVFAPEPDPETAVIALLLALFSGILHWLSRRGWDQKKEVVWLSGLGLALAFAALYLATLAPGVLPADNGEFQTAAAQLGVAHPPGFPLYTMLAHLMTRLPLGETAAYRVNLLSVFSSVGTLLLVFALVYQLTGHLPAALVAAVSLGTATTFWAQAIRANIRSLTALFAALMLYALVRYWQRAKLTAKGAKVDKQYRGAVAGLPTEPPGGRRRWLVLFAGALGFGVTHHPSLVFMGGVGVIFLLLVDPELLRAPRRWIRPALAAAAGLLPLLYLPLRAGADVRGAVPELATWDGFLYHVLAQGFSGDLFYLDTAAELGARLRVMGNVLTFQFSPWLLAGMGIGLLWLTWRRPRLGWLLGGGFLLHTLVTAAYRAPQTVEYMLPAYVPLAVGLGYGVGQLAQVAQRRERWQGPRLSRLLPAISVAATAVLLLAALSSGWRRYPSYAALHSSNDVTGYTNTILENAPPDSLVLADWHWAAPLWYQQEVAGRRPDLTVNFVFPEGDAYAETWAQRIEAGLAAGRDVIATHYNADAYRALPPPEPLGEAFWFRQTPRRALPADFTPLDERWGGAIALRGIRLEPDTAAVGETAVLTLAWKPVDESALPVTLFAHLVGENGRLYAQADVPARPQKEGLTLTQFPLAPRPGTPPGELQLLAGAYNPDPLPDTAERPRTPLAALRVTPSSWRPFTMNPTYRRLWAAPERTLVGHDWDFTLPQRPRLYLHWRTEEGYVSEIRDETSPHLPPYAGPWGLHRAAWDDLEAEETTRYVPLGQGIVWTGGSALPDPLPAGTETIALPQIFHSTRPVQRDLVVSVRLIGYEADGVHWAWWDLDDGVPAMGAIPTLKWIGGSTVRDPHWLAVAPAARPGQQVGGILRVYDAFTERPLPALDERIGQNYLGIPLGETAVGE